jgi:hypothetical protein
MACANTIWKQHIEKAEWERYPGSLMKYIMKLQLREKIKIQTNPTFRQLHEVILHVGIVLRLEAWRVEVCQRHPEVSSLDEWIESNPEWNELREIAAHLAHTTIAPPDLVSGLRPDTSEDNKVLEMTRAYHKDFLLYEKTNYAMNHGDMGRLDSCLTEWMYYFMGCGKVKYAHRILRYLENMYIKLPKPLV